MHINELKIEELVLPSDLETAYTLTFWRNYCIAQLDKCLGMQDNKGARHWTLEHQRSVNDLKYLQFKKSDHERKMKIEKRNSGIRKF